MIINYGFCNAQAARNDLGRTRRSSVLQWHILYAYEARVQQFDGGWAVEEIRDRLMIRDWLRPNSAIRDWLMSELGQDQLISSVD